MHADAHSWRCNYYQYLSFFLHFTRITSMCIIVMMRMKRCLVDVDNAVLLQMHACCLFSRYNLWHCCHLTRRRVARDCKHVEATAIADTAMILSSWSACNQRKLSAQLLFAHLLQCIHACAITLYITTEQHLLIRTLYDFKTQP
jgi:hypothetical protein